MVNEELQAFRRTFSDMYLDRIVEKRKQMQLEADKKMGYPSIDCPQSKYYRKTPIKDFSNVQTIYGMIFDNCNLDDDAVGFLDGVCNWSFRKLKTVTDNYMKVFKKYGVRENDSILMGVTNTPELIAILIAIVSLGASAKFFDIRANEKEIVEYADSSDCKYMVCLDKIVLPKVKNIINDTELEGVFVLRASNSLNPIEKLKYLYNNRKTILKNGMEKNEELPDSKKFVELSELYKRADKKEVMHAKYDPERPAITIQSSGTTGKAKTIVHSEKSAVEFSKSIAYIDLPLGRGKTVLVALPPWIAYGIGDAILMSLSMGSKVMLCADFDNNAVYRNIGRFTLSYAAPFHYRYIREHYDELTDKQRKQLRNVDCMITGGDKYAANENAADEEQFGTVILNGYGNNEDWGALSVNPAHNNRYGSVGIPKYGETTIAYDNEKQEELPYGQIGEICTLSKTAFLRYENNSVATKKVLQQHPDGKVYLHTGDLGYIDEDGFIFLGGRNERVIVRLGFKLSAYTIEDAITSLPYINECIAVEVPDRDEEHVPMVFVVPTKDREYIDKETLIQLILHDLKNRLKENEIPKYIEIVDSLKYTANNKYDFREYEKLGKEYVESLNGPVKELKK